MAVQFRYISVYFCKKHDAWASETINANGMRDRSITGTSTSYGIDRAIEDVLHAINADVPVSDFGIDRDRLCANWRPTNALAMWDSVSGKFTRDGYGEPVYGNSKQIVEAAAGLWKLEAYADARFADISLIYDGDEEFEDEVFEIEKDDVVPLTNSLARIAIETIDSFGRVGRKCAAMAWAHAAGYYDGLTCDQERELDDAIEAECNRTT